MLRNRMRLSHHHLSSTPDEPFDSGTGVGLTLNKGYGMGHADGYGPYDTSETRTVKGKQCYCYGSADGTTTPFDDTTTRDKGGSSDGSGRGPLYSKNNGYGGGLASFSGDGDGTGYHR